MYDRKSHQVSDRIVSLSQPWLRPIVRRNAKAGVEFGVKLDTSVVNGWTRQGSFSFEAYPKTAGLPAAIERYHERTGRYPARVLADKIYRNRQASLIAGNAASGFPVRHWVDQRRPQSWTKNSITSTNASA